MIIARLNCRKHLFEILISLALVYPLFSWSYILFIKYFNIGFSYPFGWDSPRYLADGNYITLYGIVSFLENSSRFNIVIPVLFAIVKVLSGTLYQKISIICSIILIILVPLSYFYIIIRKEKGLLAFASIGVFFLLPSSIILYSGLYEQLVGIILMIFLFYLLEKIELENASRKKVRYSLFAGVLLLFLWLSHKETFILAGSTWAIRLVFLTLFDRESIKKIVDKNKLYILTFVMWLILNLIYIFYINKKYIEHFLLNLENVSQTRRDFTVERFIFIGFGSYVLFVLYIIGVLISLFNKEIRRKYWYFNVWNLLLLILIIFTPPIYRELKYRASYIIPVTLFVTICLYWIYRRFSKFHIQFSFFRYKSCCLRGGIPALFVLLLLLYVFNSPAIKTVGESQLRTWGMKTADDKLFFDLLEQVRTKISSDKNVSSITILLTQSNYHSKYVLVNYILSYVPAQVIDCTDIKLSVFKLLDYKNQCKPLITNWYGIEFVGHIPSENTRIIVILGKLSLVDGERPECAFYLTNDFGCIITISK